LQLSAGGMAHARLAVLCVVISIAAVVVAKDSTNPTDSWVEDSDVDATTVDAKTALKHESQATGNGLSYPRHVHAVHPKLDLAQIKATSIGDGNSPVVTTDQVAWCTACLGVKTQDGQSALQSVATSSDLTIMWIVTAAIFILVGLYLCFLGYAWHRVTMATIGFIVFFIITFLLSCGVIGSFNDGGLVDSIVAASVSLLVGVLGAVLFVMFEWASFILVGATGGLIFALELNALVLHFLYDSIGGSGGSYTALGINIGFAIVGGILAAFECSRRPLLICATAFGGAYMLGWGILQIAMGSHSTNDVAGQLNPIVLFGGEKWNGTPMSYIMIGAFLLAGAIGACVQFRFTAQKQVGKDAEPQDFSEIGRDNGDNGDVTEPLRGSKSKDTWI